MLRRAALLATGLLLTFLTAPTAKPDGGTIIASDNFNRADENPFSISGNWGRVIAGSYDGNSALVSNEVTAVSNEGIYYWKGAGTFDPARQFARQRVVQKDGELGLVLLGGADQAIMVAWGPPGVNDTLYIYWYANGNSQGVLSQSPSTINNGDIIEAVLDGGNIYAKVNGVTVQSVANTTTLTTGTPGFITYLNVFSPQFVSKLDDWEAGTPASYTISGTVTESSAGLSGVLVTASGGFSGSATTDSNGDYTITGVPPDATSILLTPTLSGHTMSPTTRTVAGPVTADVTDQDFTSTLNTGATLTIHATHGSVTRDPDQPSYTFGTVVTLTPVPAGGYSFSAWSGDVPVGHETDNPLQVTMSADREITAHFTSATLIAADNFNRPNETPLAVGGNWTQPFGGVTVNLSGNQIAAVGSGEALYNWQGPGTFDNSRQYARMRVVQPNGQLGLVLLGSPGKALVAAWGSGRLFIYWYSGGSHQGELANIASTLQAGDEIEAVLDQGRVYAKINGSVVHSVVNTTSLTSGKPGFESYQSGATFDDWEAGTPPTFAVSGTITENASGLSGVLVTASGGFSGTTTTDANGAFTFPAVPAGATSIVLTPTLFGHTMTPTSRTVTGPLTDDVTGQDFTSTLQTGAILTVNATHGTVTKDPDQPSYEFGTIVTLTPVPDGGYSFAGWSGDVPAGHESDNPLQVTMDQNRTITASFASQGLGASDDFNRANETPFATGGDWLRALPGGTANLTSQHVEGSSGDALYYWQGAGTFSATRQYARASVVSAAGQVGLVLLGGNNRGLVTAWNGGTLFIYWYTGGSYQGNLTTLSSTVQAGDEIEAVLDGGRVYAKINGTVVANVPNTTTLGAGTPGFETFSSGGALDDWEGGIPPSYAISGTVLESGNGLSGVQVTATGGFTGSTTTDGAGYYTLTNIPAGTTSVVVTPTLGGHSMSPTSRTIAGPITADVPGQDFTSTPAAGAVLFVNANHGTVTRDPDLPAYPFGSDVVLTPVPDAGYTFVSWSGDVPAGHENDNPLTLTMSQDRTVTALFIGADVVAWDDFNRANETPFAIGGNWTRPFSGGTANLTSQRVAGVSSEALYYWQGAGSFTSTHQFARSRVVQASGQVGLALLGSSGKALVVAWNGGTVFIYWYTNSTYQGNLTTASSTVQPGDTIEALLDGGIVYAKVNGAVVASATNTTSLTTGNPGFETFQSGGSFDDWEAGPPTSTCTGQPDGTSCDDANACTSSSTCQGGICVGGSASCDDGNPCTVDSCNPSVGCGNTPGNAGAVCRASAGQCDVAETCTGSSSVCPADAFASSATTCTGTSQGGTCDATDHCSGTANTCVDEYQPSGFVCRAAVDGCDAAETCTGSSGTCPADLPAPGLGVACDGPDSDLCNEGITVCTAGTITCDDTSGDNLDLCNGVDDDCDPASADGSEDPTIGAACDGPDSDLCIEGVSACADGSITCSDTTGSTLDICNGLDDDCDPASADGSEDPAVGVSCDGTDSDLCNEGVTVCSSGTVSCNDTTGDSLDVCNGLDDDCDPASADGSEGPAVGACDGPDSDLCAEGIGVCVLGIYTCTDLTGSTVDVCNGLDDDCDPASADGSEDPGVGVACDGPDSDLCNEGVTVCSGGTVSCSDTTGSTVDICNGLDDDCDPSSADGSEDPTLGAACDGPDSDLCIEGVTVCSGGAPTCSDTTGSTLDICNGLDDDCDPASADGSEDPGVGVACDGPDSDLCIEGVTVCSGGAPTCSDTTGSTLDLCNGVDDDCDPASADGSEDPSVGVACDGPDSDLCNEGTTVCSGGAVSCTDTTGSTVDICNGVDDDCDPSSADGSEDPTLGAACDGPDSDLCIEGVTVCSGGAPTCSDTTGSTLDICNGVDDDCDPASADGSEDPTVGVACDGPDSDLCNEGTRVCTGGAVSCTDTTGSTVDLCNGLDDDCDPASVDGSEDPTVGIACDGPDTDLCLEGTSSCVAGAVACSDNTTSTVEVCNGLDDNCNGTTDENGPALCDDGNSCNGAEVCAGATGCQAGTPPTVASAISIPDFVTGLSGGTLVVPVLANPATGTAIDLRFTYDTAVLQAVSVQKSLITSAANMTVDLAVPGQIHVTLLAPAPLQGSGALVFVRFNVLGPIGGGAVLGFPQATIDGGSTTSCHDPGHATFCDSANIPIGPITVSSKTNTTVSWTKINGGFHRYDLIGGTLADLRADRSIFDATCLSNSTNQGSANDPRPTPAVGSGYYYLLRTQNECTVGTYDTSSRGDERWALAACP